MHVPVLSFSRLVAWNFDVRNEDKKRRVYDALLLMAGEIIIRQDFIFSEYE